MRTLSLSWSGARQGIITSGLNHVAHAGARKIRIAQVLSRLESEFAEIKIYNPKETSPTAISLNQQFVFEYLIENLPTLKAQDGKLGKRYGYTISSFSLGEGDSLGSTLGDYNTSTAIINLYQESFSNLFKLASVVYHEQVHAWHYVSGIHQLWYNSYGEGGVGALYSLYRSEAEAYYTGYLYTSDLYYLDQFNTYNRAYKRIENVH